MLRFWPRWLYLTPDRLALGGLLTVVYLRVAQPMGWYGVIPNKGWTEIRAAMIIAYVAGCTAASIVLGRMLRRPVQFSVRSILMAMVGVAIVAGWLTEGIGPASRQQRAVASLDQFGAHVNRSRPGPSPPEWQLRLLGEDYFATVTHVDFRSRPVPDGAIALLVDCPGIESVDLTRASISNEGLRHFASIRSLQVLNLSDTGVDDEGMRHLAHLTSLRILDLSNTAISDAGLAHLRNCRGMRRLSLNGNSRITGCGLENLSRMPRLEGLSVCCTGLTDEGLRRMPKLHRLHDLSLSRTRITDAGTAELVRLPRLRTLSLAGTTITDASVVHLVKLQSLRQLYLSVSDISEGGVAELKKALEDTQVDWLPRSRPR
jgi:hypothetical protein